MINNKYNPLKGKKEKLNSSMNRKGLIVNKNTITTFIFKIVIVIVFIFVIKYIYDKFMTDMKKANSDPKGIKESDYIFSDFNVNLVPSGNKIVEGFNIIANAEAENTFFGLSPSEQSNLCSNKSDQIVGYRNAVSGATFRFQKVDPTKNDDEADYFLLGDVNNGKVIEVDVEDNLTTKPKNSDEEKQHFKRLKKTDTQDTFYFITKLDVTDNNQPRALQYEFEHLSLRKTKTGNVPYEGQLFIKMPDSDINKQGVSYGLGTAHLDSGDLQRQRPVTYVVNTSNPQSVSQVVGATQTSTNDENLNEAVSRVLTAFDEYKRQQENNASGSAIGNEPLRVNLNLGSSSSGFANISNLESFQNLRGVQGNDVRSLLNAYTRQSSASFGNNNLAGIGSSNTTFTSLGDIYDDKLRQAARGTSFRGCPNIDRSKYITTRQASRCYGCSAGEGEK